jgi:hypothetical protein
MRHACVRLTGNGGAPYVRDAIAINTTPQQSEGEVGMSIDDSGSRGAGPLSELGNEEMLAAFRKGVDRAIEATFALGDPVTLGDDVGVYREWADGRKEYVRRYADEDRNRFR